MSAPAGLWQAPNGQGNPDGRPLPPGFVTQFDPQYNAWFYINTGSQPPRSQWIHPADHHDQNNPPNGGVNWDARYPSQGDRGPPSGQFGGGGYAPQGSYGPGGGYPPPQVQQKSSSNTGAMLAAGGAGLVGGALIANALSDDDYQDGYEAGLEAADEEN
ncbi:Got1 domain-containing protein [Ceratobasidium sp. AG-Ba]|nr:Got1 domain-containing protein [Ceratobasidium sp. AG-Ba]QRW03731.1 Got1 domain-containing protein [Ceratobasidium sp. AG-Ba]